jgi:hypothetical protein
MTTETAAALAVLAVMLALFGGAITRLVGLLREEHRRRLTARRGHTWADTAAIAGFLLVFGGLAAYGATDKQVILGLLLTIALYYTVRRWRERRQDTTP